MVAGNERYLFENPALRKGFVRSLDCEIYRTAEMRCSEAHSAFRRPSFRRRSLLSLSMIRHWPDAIIMTCNDCCPPFCVLIRVTANAEIFLLLRSFFFSVLFFFIKLRQGRNYYQERCTSWLGFWEHGIERANAIISQEKCSFCEQRCFYSSHSDFFYLPLLFLSFCI